MIVNIRDYPRGLPPDVVRIDRTSPWGNPFRIGRDLTRAEVIALYRDWLARRLAVDPQFIEPLRGKRLACWCAPQPCHGEVILEALAG